jgi:hypothetical protein
MLPVCFGLESSSNLTASKALDGCSMFAPAYMGRKRFLRMLFKLASDCSLGESILRE